MNKINKKNYIFIFFVTFSSFKNVLFYMGFYVKMWPLLLDETSPLFYFFLPNFLLGCVSQPLCLLVFFSAFLSVCLHHSFYLSLSYGQAVFII